MRIRYGFRADPDPFRELYTRHAYMQCATKSAAIETESMATSAGTGIGVPFIVIDDDVTKRDIVEISRLAVTVFYLINAHLIKWQRGIFYWPLTIIVIQTLIALPWHY